MSFWKAKAAKKAPEKRGTPAAPEAHPALQQCREDNTPLVFTCGDPPSLLHGRLSRLLERHIVITLDALDHGAKPVEGHVMSCSFSHGARSGAFFARLHKWIEQEGKLEMVLELPNDVLYIDVRRAFRIPTRGISWIAATVKDANGKILKQILNISRVELGLAADGSAFAAGEEVRVVVTTDKHPLLMPAKVAVAKGSFLGLSLEEPSDSWLDLVSRLERDWMRRNRG